MEKFIEWILTGLIAFLGSLSMYRISVSRKFKKEMYERIDKKADIDYVDKRISETHEVIKDSNIIIKDNINSHVSSDDKRWIQLFSELHDMKTQQNIILTKLLEK